eukprot:1146181-Pelagomonas_calceolata.AAC.1
MGVWGRRLLDGLLTGGRDASLKGWPTTRRVRNSLFCSLAVLLVGGTHSTKLALKLHAHFVRYAYKLASTRRALEKTSLTSHRQDQAQATASNPPDPH